jgi:AAA domain
MGDDPKFTFKLFKRSDFGKAPGVRWLVPGLFVERGITLMYGEPKKGKSLIFSSIACTATAEYADESDRLWCGLPVHKMRMCYIAPEGFNGLLGRHDSWENIQRARVSDDLMYMQRPVNFFCKPYGSKPRSDVEQVLRDLDAQKFYPNYFFVDTLSRSMAGGNENSPDDMTRVFEQAEELCRKLNAGLAFSAHSTKDGTNFRGTGAIFASVDGLLECKSDKPLQITLTPIDFKDAAAGNPVTVQCETSVVDTEEGPQDIPAVKERIDRVDEPWGSRPGKSEGKMSDTNVVVAAVVRVLAWQFPGEAVRRTDLHKAVETDLGRAVDPQVMNRALEKLQKTGAIGQAYEKGPYQLLIQPGADGWSNRLGVSDIVTLGPLQGPQGVSLVTDTQQVTVTDMSPTQGCEDPAPVVLPFGKSESEADEALAVTLQEAMATIRKQK